MTYQLKPNNWVQSYKYLLHNYARARVRDELAIEDLVQDTFLAGLQSRDRFKGDSKESTWLISILRHKIVDYYRSQNTLKGRTRKSSLSETEYHLTYGKEITLDTLELNDTLNDIFKNEFKLTVNEGFKTLTNSESKVMKLKLNGFDTLYICDKLEISRDNYWVLLHRARKKLKEHIYNQWTKAS